MTTAAHGHDDFGLVGRDTVHRALGIRFAEPPVEDRRWRPPVYVAGADNHLEFGVETAPGRGWRAGPLAFLDRYFDRTSPDA